MGDRCYLRLYIHGHIKTVDDLMKIDAAITADGLDPEYYGDRRWTIAQTFAMAVANNFEPEFYGDEINYGSIEDTETMLQICGVAYHIDHGAGSEYPPGAASWTPERGRLSTICTTDGNAVVEIDDVEKAYRDKFPFQALAELIEQTRYANGKGMPTFSVSDEVRQHLATIIALDALGVGNEGRAA